MRTLLFATILFSTLFAQARPLESGFYGSFGVGLDSMTIENGSHSSRFEGYSPNVGFGGLYPIGQQTAILGGIELKQIQVKNKSESSKFIETLDGTSTSARLGLQFASIGGGAFFSQDQLEAKQITAGGASARTKLKGDSHGYFLNYALMPSTSYMLSFEAAYNSGEANSGYTYSDFAGTMKFFLFF